MGIEGNNSNETSFEEILLSKNPSLAREFKLIYELALQKGEEEGYAFLKQRIFDHPLYEDAKKAIIENQEPDFSLLEEVLEHGVMFLYHEDSANEIINKTLPQTSENIQKVLAKINNDPSLPREARNKSLDQYAFEVLKNEPKEIRNYPPIKIEVLIDELERFVMDIKIGVRKPWSKSFRNQINYKRRKLLALINEAGMTPKQEERIQKIQEFLFNKKQEMDEEIRTDYEIVQKFYNFLKRQVQEDITVFKQKLWQERILKLYELNKEMGDKLENTGSENANMLIDTIMDYLSTQRLEKNV